MIRFYVEVARTAFRRQLIYRWANLAGLATNVFFAAIASYVVIALYHARHVAGAGHYNLGEALRYIWLLQAMVMVVLPFGWFDLMLTIRSGEVAADLSKPCDFCWYWFSRQVGQAAYYVVFRGLPTYLLGLLFFRIGAPADPPAWLLYAASFSLGAGLGIAFRFVYNVVAFWTVEARAVGGLAATIALFFTGSFVPLAFFPPWLHTLATWLPFNGMMNLPAEIFLGKITAPSVPFELLRQALWLVALVLAARALAVVAARRVVVQGG